MTFKCLFAAQPGKLYVKEGLAEAYADLVEKVSHG